MNQELEGQNGTILVFASEQAARTERAMMVAEQPPGDTTKITVHQTTVRAGGVTAKVWTVTMRWE